MDDKNFDWINYYMELADKLVAYRNDRKELLAKLQRIFEPTNLKFPTLESDRTVKDIDPFTVFGMFNRQIKLENRLDLIKGISKEFDMQAAVPTGFDGIPIVYNRKANFFAFEPLRGDSDIDHLWDVYEAALFYSQDASEANKKTFVSCYDIVLKQYGIKWNITMGLYWIRPYTFLNLDGRNQWFITNIENMPESFVSFAKPLLENAVKGEDYLQIIDMCKKALQTGDYTYKNFPELSSVAWNASEAVNKQIKQDTILADNTMGDNDVETVHYWMYAPGHNAEKWEECCEKGIMLLGWGEIGDISKFSSSTDIAQKMRSVYGGSHTYKNSAHATWQFMHEMKPNDIVFVKKGTHEIVGRGIVTSDYQFDAERTDGYNNIRNVTWTDKGSWPMDIQAVKKTLTDITPYTDNVQRIKDLFDKNAEAADEEDESIVNYPLYTEDDFLNDVYMSEKQYTDLKKLLLNKKNIILQGAPGVGKTFVAKRLAYSIMGEKDINRVDMVQFHQNYSYEDFIMGYRPNETDSGFHMHYGEFYTFCKKAEGDNDYFFIIDEINRGNLSKIFGELFMLIEKDKRGTELQLLYTGEKFQVPPRLHLIGTMNTADRSLAMLDYALRRRFAFFDLRPAFDSEGFMAYQAELNNKKFDALVEAVKKLNSAIAEDDSLGEGFCIGHSYFCNLKPENNNDDALNEIIEYELIPLLKEYWFDEPEKVREWADFLRKAVK